MSENNGAGTFRVDAKDLSLREHAAAVEAAEPYKDHPAASDYVVAGMAWQTRLRTDPTFTFEQALDLKFSDLDIPDDVPAGDDAPEVPGADTGAAPQSSDVPGESVPAT